MGRIRALSLRRFLPLVFPLTYEIAAAYFPVAFGGGAFGFRLDPAWRVKRIAREISGDVFQNGETERQLDGAGASIKDLNKLSERTGKKPVKLRLP